MRISCLPPKSVLMHYGTQYALLAKLPAVNSDMFTTII